MVLKCWESTNWDLIPPKERIPVLSASQDNYPGYREGYNSLWPISQPIIEGIILYLWCVSPNTSSVTEPKVK